MRSVYIHVQGMPSQHCYPKSGYFPHHWWIDRYQHWHPHCRFCWISRPTSATSGRLLFKSFCTWGRNFFTFYDVWDPDFQYPSLSVPSDVSLVNFDFKTIHSQMTLFYHFFVYFISSFLLIMDSSPMLLLYFTVMEINFCFIIHTDTYHDSNV